MRQLASIEARHAYGSLNPGIAGWQQRWEEPRRIRVLMLASMDAAGSFMRWARALNQGSDVAARMAVFLPHDFGYSLDMLFPHPLAGNSGLADLAAEADLIHIKDEIGYFDGSNRLHRNFLLAFDKPLVFTLYGSWARGLGSDRRYISHVRRFDARVAMTPDLIFPGHEARFVPHTINVDEFKYSWSDTMRIAHTPSKPYVKGTAELEDALDELRAEFEFDYDLVTGVDHAEVLRRVRRAGLFFDQAYVDLPGTRGPKDGIGWYANSALEAAVHGIPTIAHLSDRAFSGAEAAGRDLRDRCAIINTPLGVDGIRETIRTYLESSPDDRMAISLATRAWVEEFHGFSPVARDLSAVYASVLG